MEKKEPGFVIFVLWSFLSSGCFTGGMVHKWSCMLRPTALKYDHGSSSHASFLFRVPILVSVLPACSTDSATGCLPWPRIQHHKPTDSYDDRNGRGEYRSHSSVRFIKTVLKIDVELVSLFMKRWWLIPKAKPAPCHINMWAASASPFTLFPHSASLPMPWLKRQPRIPNCNRPQTHNDCKKQE